VLWLTASASHRHEWRHLRRVDAEVVQGLPHSFVAGLCSKHRNLHVVREIISELAASVQTRGEVVGDQSSGRQHFNLNRRSVGAGVIKAFPTFRVCVLLDVAAHLALISDSQTSHDETIVSARLWRDAWKAAPTNIPGSSSLTA
jgi:hypothetical protein